MRKEGRMCNIYSRFTSEKNRSQVWRKKSRKAWRKQGMKKNKMKQERKFHIHSQVSHSCSHSHSRSTSKLVAKGSKRKKHERRAKEELCSMKEREREWMPSSTLPFIACYIMDWITSGVRESSNVVLVVELILWEKKKKRRVSDAFG